MTNCPQARRLVRVGDVLGSSSFKVLLVNYNFVCVEVYRKVLNDPFVFVKYLLPNKRYLILFQVQLARMTIYLQMKTIAKHSQILNDGR